MIVIDANALVLLIVGLMDTAMIGSHKRTSIYEKQDFDDMVFIIERVDNLIVLPNVWTEVDNLLNNFTGDHKEVYLETLIETIKSSTEHYSKTLNIITDYAFIDLGITDTLLLQVAKQHQLLITGDSKLSDYAMANEIHVHDLKSNRNKRLQ